MLGLHRRTKLALFNRIFAGTRQFGQMLLYGDPSRI
jgi:hypothetical protein